MGCIEGFALCWTFLINFIFWLSGAAILGLGIWVISNPGIDDFEDLDLGSNVKSIAYLLIGLGSFIFMVGFCGCCGAVMQNKFLLVFYIFFLSIAFLATLGLIVMATLNKSEVVSDTFKKELKEYSTNNEIRKIWDSLQSKKNCCGYDGPDDYEKNSWATENAPKKIPTSCCIMDDKDSKPKDEAKCQAMTAEYHEKGCKDFLNNTFINLNKIFGILCAAAVLEFIGLILSIILCVNDRNKWKHPNRHNVRTVIYRRSHLHHHHHHR